MAKKPEKLLLNEHEAAAMLGVSTKTLQARRYKHLPPAYYKFKRGVRYKIDDLITWVESHRVEMEV